MAKKPDSKQRLLEVMSRLDPTFKPKLNEDYIMNNPQTPYQLSALKMPEAQEVTFIIDAASDEEALAKAKEQFATETNNGMNLGRAILFKGNTNLGNINEAEKTSYSDDMVNDIKTLLGTRPSLSPKEIQQLATDYQVGPEEVQQTVQYVLDSNKENQPQVPNNSQEAEGVNDFFSFLKNNPRTGSIATVQYASTLDRGLAKPKQNPMMGKFLKLTNYGFEWERTYSAEVEKVNPDWEVQQRKGDYTQVEGFSVVKRDRSGDEVFDIIPRNPKSIVLILGDNGEVVDTLKSGELQGKYAQYFQPSFFAPSQPSSGSGVPFRALKLYAVRRLAAGGKEWINPKFKYEKYSQYFDQIPKGEE